MTIFLLRTLLVAVILVTAAQLSQRLPQVGALLISLPVSSIIALTLLYHDTGDVQQVATLATGILWMIIPSTLFFIILPWFLRKGFSYYAALGLACGLTATAYAAFTWCQATFPAIRR